MKAHHTAICTDDIETSLRFWRDGMGLEVQMDQRFEGDWPTLFDAPRERLRSVFLGEEQTPDAGIVELVDFDQPLEPAPSASASRRGVLLLSFFVDLDAVLGRLAEAGLGGDPRQITVAGGVRMAVVEDPNGVLVELIHAPG